jgi:hypothetical protein
MLWSARRTPPVLTSRNIKLEDLERLVEISGDYPSIYRLCEAFAAGTHWKRC